MDNDTIIAIGIAAQTCIPVFLWGPPGVGKTATIEQLAKQLGTDMWTLILSIREPSDQGGLPYVTRDGASLAELLAALPETERSAIQRDLVTSLSATADGVTAQTMHSQKLATLRRLQSPPSVSLIPPRWATELAQKGEGWVFMDELNASPPTTQSSALRVVHGGYAGDQRLPERTSFIAAGNPPGTSAGTYHLTAAMANRWLHFDFSAKGPGYVSHWRAGMMSGWPALPVAKVGADWQKSVSAKRGLVASFIEVQHDYLHVQPTDQKQQGMAWPSPRTWERVAIVLAAAESAKHDVKSSVTRLLIRGAVGEVAGDLFIKWYTDLDLISPEEYLADPKRTALPIRQDQIMATLDAIASAALDKKHPKFLQRYRNAWAVYGRVCDQKRVDLCIPGLRTLADNIPAEIQDPKGPGLPDEILLVSEMIEKAGIDYAIINKR